MHFGRIIFFEELNGFVDVGKQQLVAVRAEPPIFSLVTAIVNHVAYFGTAFGANGPALKYFLFDGGHIA